MASPYAKMSYGRQSYGTQGNRFRPAGGLAGGLARSMYQSQQAAPAQGGYPGGSYIDPNAGPQDIQLGGGPLPSGSIPPPKKPLPGPAPDQTPPATGGGNQQPGGQQGPGFNPNALSFEGDPILQKIRALNQAAVQNAHSAELSKRKQAFIGYGHLQGEPTDIYPDQQTAQAAEQNPFSALAQLLHNHELRTQGIDQGLNQGNLYYSSTRGTRLGEEGRQYLGEQAGANNNLASALGGFNNEVLGAEQGAAQSNMDAEQGAYQRALDFALQYGTGGAGGGPGGAGHGGAQGQYGPGAHDPNVYWYDEQGNPHYGNEPLPDGWVSKGLVQNPNGSTGIWGPPDAGTAPQPPPAVAPPSAGSVMPPSVLAALLAPSQSTRFRGF